MTAVGIGWDWDQCRVMRGWAALRYALARTPDHGRNKLLSASQAAAGQPHCAGPHFPSPIDEPSRLPMLGQENLPVGVREGITRDR